MGIALPWRWLTWGGFISPQAAECLMWVWTPVLITVALVVLPSTWLSLPTHLGSGCLLTALCGVPCPGCGVTRSLIAIAHGDLAHGWMANPVGPVVAAALLVQVVLGVFVQIRIFAFEILLIQALWTDTVVGACLVAVWCARILHLIPVCP